MSRHDDPFRLRRLDIAKVVVLGLSQVVVLTAFLLLTMAVVNGLTPTTVGAAADAARRQAFLELAALVVVAGLQGVLRAAQFRVSEKAGYNVVRDLRMIMYAHLQGMTQQQLQHRARGGLLLRFVGDLSMLRMWLSRGLLGGIVSVIVLFGAVAVLMSLNLWIGLAILCVVALGAALSLGSGRQMRAATRAMRRRRSLVTGNIDEQINSLPVVQVFGRAPGEYARLSRQNEALNDSLCHVADLRGRLRGIASAFALLSVVAVLGVGLVEVQRGSATVGLVVASVLVTRQLVTPLRTIGLAHDYWHRSRVSRHKIDDFLNSSSAGLEPPGLGRLRVRKGRIEFRDVTVRGALDGVTLTAEAGQHVAITGSAGAGKSTLLALVARLRTADAGDVLIDEQVLAETTPRSTFRYVGLVSPDLPLMRGTVRRNLTYSAPDAPEEEIQRVVLASGLDQVLADLPGGLDAWVTEGGRNLSAAQRQRIALGRALLGNPPILLLDNPTAGLDPDTKREFRELVARHQGTVLLVTHDPDELAMADQVWRLDRGHAVDSMSGDEFQVRMRLAGKKGTSWASEVAS